jgi:hypothetical protein
MVKRDQEPNAGGFEAVQVDVYGIATIYLACAPFLGE